MNSGKKLIHTQKTPGHHFHFPTTTLFEKLKYMYGISEKNRDENPNGGRCIRRRPSLPFGRRSTEQPWMEGAEVQAARPDNFLGGSTGHELLCGQPQTWVTSDTTIIDEDLSWVLLGTLRQEAHHRKQSQPRKKKEQLKMASRGPPLPVNSTMSLEFGVTT